MTEPALLLSDKLRTQAAATEPLAFRQAPHNIDAEQALLRHQPRDIPGILGGVGARERAWREVLLGETPHRVAERFLLRGESEVHRGAPRQPRVGHSGRW